MNQRELLTAKKLIITYLSMNGRNANIDKIIHEISIGNEELIKKYILAIKDILEKALLQLENDNTTIELLNIWEN